MGELVRINLKTLDATPPTPDAVRAAYDMISYLRASAPRDAPGSLLIGASADTFAAANRLIDAWAEGDTTGMREAADGLLASAPNNFAVGSCALAAVTIGDHNFAFGPEALCDVITDSYLFAVNN